jgi:hypothetical protein
MGMMGVMEAIPPILPMLPTPPILPKTQAGCFLRAAFTKLSSPSKKPRSSMT